MSACVAARRRMLILVCIVSSGWAFSFGLGASITSLWLADHSCNFTVLGFNTAAYYAGIALTAALLPRLMAFSTRGCIVAGLLLAAVTTAFFPLVDGLGWWFSLRAICGAGTALCLIPLETLVNRNAPTERRACDFGFYASAVAFGIGIGSVVGLLLYPHWPKITFAVGGLLPLLAVIPTWNWLPGGGRGEETPDENGSMVFRRHLLELGTAWAQGFLEGGMVTFLSIYLIGLGHSDATAGVLMGVMFVGVMAFQVPIAWLADLGGRVRVLLGCHALVLIGMLLMPFFSNASLLGGLLFLVGGGCAALYPLGLALLGQRLPAEALGRANALYLACNCAGSLTGPVIMGLAMRFAGPVAMFVTGAGAVAVVVVGSALVRRTVRRAAPAVCQVRYIVPRRAV